MNKCGNDAHQYEVRIANVRESPEDVFGLWSTRVKTTRNSGELEAALHCDDTQLHIDERAAALIIAALGDNLRWTIKDCTTTKAA